jgi:hypothetical protein
MQLDAGPRVSVAAMRSWETHVGEGVEKHPTEGEKEHDDAEPHEDKLALVLVRRRRANAEDEGQTAKHSGQEFNHCSLRNSNTLQRFYNRPVL